MAPLSTTDSSITVAPHPDEGPVADRARVDRAAVADRDLVPDQRRDPGVGHVHHRQVLQVRALSDPDVAHVAANHAAKPHARAHSDLHVADHGRARGQVDVGSDPGRDPVMGQQERLAHARADSKHSNLNKNSACSINLD
jgi:hypothetical protein